MTKWWLLSISVGLFAYFLTYENVLLFSGLGAKGLSKTANMKVVLNGGQQVSFIRSDGSFALYPFNFCQRFESAEISRSETCDVLEHGGCDCDSPL